LNKHEASLKKDATWIFTRYQHAFKTIQNMNELQIWLLHFYSFCTIRNINLILWKWICSFWPQTFNVLFQWEISKIFSLKYNVRKRLFSFLQQKLYQYGISKKQSSLFSWTVMYWMPYSFLPNRRGHHLTLISLFSSDTYKLPTIFAFLLVFCLTK
jgi:hypothetical protein